MKGTHGTSMSRAISIKDNGFNTKSIGLRGSGAYFWGYTINALEKHVRDLAVAWWRFAHDTKNLYKNDEDKRCCVLFASLESSPADLFDFENQEIRDKFFNYSQEVFPRLKGTDEEKCSAIYDMYLHDIESKLKREFKIIHVKVQQPRKFTKHLPLDITGQPSCYVVKDLSCIIAIDKFEELNDE
jgi:hypothetical protein